MAGARDALSKAVGPIRLAPAARKASLNERARDYHMPAARSN